MNRKKTRRAALTAVQALARANNPKTAPPWRVSHSVLAVCLVAFLALLMYAGGLIADVGSAQVGGREWLMRLRVAVIGLAMFNVFVLRDSPWWRVVGFILISTGILMNIARNDWDTFTPLTVSFLLILVGLLLEVGGVTYRPTVNERLRECESEVKDRNATIDALEKVVQQQGDLLALQAAKLAEYEKGDRTA